VLSNQRINCIPLLAACFMPHLLIRFLVDKVALGQGFPQVLQFLLPINIPSELCTFIYLPLRRVTGCTSRHRVMTSVPIISCSMILKANYCYGSNHHFYRWTGVCPKGRDNGMFIKAVLIPGGLKTISRI
jgi:hypothetical protein